MPGAPRILDPPLRRHRLDLVPLALVDLTLAVSQLDHAITVVDEHIWYYWNDQSVHLKVLVIQAITELLYCEQSCERARK